MTLLAPKPTAAEVFGAGLVWMIHPDPTEGSRNFEPEQVEDALARGFRYATEADATSGTPRDAAPSLKDTGGYAVVDGIRYHTEFGMVSMRDAFGNRSVEPERVPAMLEKGWTLA